MVHTMTMALTLPSIIITDPTGQGVPFKPSFAGPIRVPRHRIPTRASASSSSSSSTRKHPRLTASRAAPPAPPAQVCINVRVAATDDILALRLAPSTTLDDLRRELRSHVSPTMGVHGLFCSSGDLELDSDFDANSGYAHDALCTHWSAFLSRASRNGDALNLVLL